ncbi:hypothetical protein GXW82_02505 [Streptacidiphilus sp. 4-A2]|nr:hypothetical protein [Streptacidiphilus sp. 4-A2]
MITLPSGPGPTGNSHPTVTREPDHGTVDVGDNTLTYTPYRGFVGRDCFRYSRVDREDRTLSQKLCVKVHRTLAATGTDDLPLVPVSMGLVGAGAATWTLSRRIGRRY